MTGVLGAAVMLPGATITTQPFIAGVTGQAKNGTSGPVTTSTNTRYTSTNKRYTSTNTSYTNACKRLTKPIMK